MGKEGMAPSILSGGFTLLQLLNIYHIAGKFGELTRLEHLAKESLAY